MDPLQFVSTARVAVVAGKGGVGKTTVTAVLARAAIRRGLRVLVVELDGKPTLEHLLPDVEVQHISATAALGRVPRHARAVAGRRSGSPAAGSSTSWPRPAPASTTSWCSARSSSSNAAASTTWSWSTGRPPATPSRSCSSPKSLLATVRGGPIDTQATEVAEMLADPDRCQVVLVTLPETTPVNELIETAYALEERVGVHLGPVVVNAVDDGPLLAADGRARGLADAGRRRVPQRPPRAARRRTGPARPSDSTSPSWSCRWCPGSVLDADAVDRLADELGRVMTGPTTTLDEHLADAGVLVCCGSGGVGKTTTAAALGLAGRTCSAAAPWWSPSTRPSAWPTRSGVPGGLTNDPVAARPSTSRGELWALMLDTATTFDGLVRANAADAEQAERILANRFYRNVAGSAVGHPGVHGGRAAARAARRPALRPGHRRHPAHPQRARLPRRARARSPGSSTIRCSSC